MSDAIATIFAIALIVFCIAWVTILPTLGLFYLFGWVAP